MNNRGHLNFGVIGCGFIAERTYLPILSKRKDVKVVAVCDKNETLGRGLANKYDVPHFYPDFDDMLQQEKLDVVVVLTPIQVHTPLIIKAMEAGCNVLVEKPMTLTSADADAVLECARQHTAKLCVSHSILFIPSVRKMLDIVKKGDIGDVLRVDVRHGMAPLNHPLTLNPDHWWHKLPGGVIGEALPHPVYIAMALLKDLEIVSVHARKFSNIEHIPFDELDVVLENKNSVATIAASCRWPGLFSVDIMGTKMNLHVNVMNQIILKCKRMYPEGKNRSFLYALENLNRSFQILNSTAWAASQVISGKQLPHRFLVDKFIDSIRNNTEQPVTPEEGRDNVRMCENIVKLI